MAFCKNCGANLGDAKFCGGCGSPAETAPPVMSQPAEASPAPGGPIAQTVVTPPPVMNQPAEASPGPEGPIAQPAMTPPPVMNQPAEASPAPEGPIVQPVMTPPPAPQPVMAASAPVQQAPTYQQPETFYQQAPYQAQPGAAPFTGQPAQNYTQSAPGYQQPGYPPQQPGYPAQPNGYQQPPPGYQQGYPQIQVTDAQMKKGMAILAYFSYLVLIPLLAAKDDPFARYHVNQGLVLTIVFTILAAVSNVLGSILLPISAMLTLIVTGLLGLMIIAVCVLNLIGIINAAKGRMKPVPIFGGITLIK